VATDLHKSKCYIGTQLANMFESLNREAEGVPFYENFAVFDADFNLVAAAVPEGDVPNILAFPEYMPAQMAVEAH